MRQVCYLLEIYRDARSPEYKIDAVSTQAGTPKHTGAVTSLGDRSPRQPFN